MLPISDQIKLRFRLLYEAYLITDGYQATHIYFQPLYDRLKSYSEEKISREIRFLKDDGLIDFKYLAGFSISHYGIREVEQAIIEPDNNTLLFPRHISEYVEVTQEIRHRIIDIRKKRSIFLRRAYDLAGGNDLVVLNLFNVGEGIGYDKGVLPRIYEYLEQEGLIQFRYTGGDFSITRKAIETIDQPLLGSDYSRSIVWSGFYPDLEKIVDDIINSVDILNNLSESKIGCKLFKANAKTFNDLRNDQYKINNDIRDESTFVLIILRTSTILDDLYRDDILKFVQKHNKPGSINLIETLFESREIQYDRNIFQTLRKLHRLRNVKQPIHSAETEAISILNEFGVTYPIYDWAKVSEVCLVKFLESLNQLIVSLERWQSYDPSRRR